MNPSENLSPNVSTINVSQSDFQVNRIHHIPVEDFQPSPSPASHDAAPSLHVSPETGTSCEQTRDREEREPLLTDGNNSEGEDIHNTSYSNQVTSYGSVEASSLLHAYVTSESSLTTEASDHASAASVTDTSWSRSQKFTLVTLAFSRFCNAVLGSLLSPFFPIEAKQKGASSIVVGLIFGSYQLMVFLLSPFYGHFMTKIGAKFMFVTGILVCSTTGMLFGVLEWCPPGWTYIVMCFSVRGVEAVAAAGQSTANLAIASFTFPNHVSTVMGILSACGMLGLTTGPPIGGFLYSVGGFFLPFVVCGGVSLCCGLVSICLLPSPRDEEGDSKRTSQSRWSLLCIPIVPIVGFLVFVSEAAIGFVDVGLSIHLQQIKESISFKIIGVVFLIPSAIVIFFAPIYGALTDRWNWLGKPIMIIGIAVGSVGFMGVGPVPFIPLSPKVWIVMVGLAICGLGWGSIVVTYQQFVLAARKHGFPDNMETNGIISGLYNSFTSAGCFVGPTLGGILLDNIGFQWSSLVFISLGLLSGFILAVYTMIECCCITSTSSDECDGVEESSTCSSRASLRSHDRTWTC